MPMVAAAAAVAFSAISTAVTTVGVAVGGALASAGLTGIGFSTALAASQIGLGITTFGASLAAGSFSAWATAIGVGGSLASLIMAHPPASVGGALAMKLDPQAAIPIMFGRTATGGNVVYRETWGSNNRYASLISVLSAGPIQSIDAYYANNFLVNFASSPLNSLQSSTSISPNGGNTKMFVNRIRQEYRLGVSPEATLATGQLADPTMTGSTFQLSGLAHVLHVYDYNQAAFPNLAIPAGVWVGHGIKCYDPRQDATYPGGSGSQRLGQPSTYAWSQNPYICALNWALGIYDGNTRIAGIGAPASMIDMAAFVACAAVADANGWTCGGVSTSADDKFAVLTSLLQAGSGQPIARGAKLSCFVNTPLTSLYTLTEKDVVGEIQIVNTTASRDRKNRIVPQYREETQFWNIIAGQLIAPASFIAADNGEYKTMEPVYSYCQNATQAQQLASYDLCNSREYLTVSLVCRPYLNGFEVGQAITLNLPEAALTNQKVVIISKEFDPQTLLVTLKCRSETDSKHAFALGQSQTAPAAPALSVPANQAPGVQAWSIVAETTTAADGSTVPAIVISGACDSPTAQDVVFEYSTDASTWQVFAKGPAATTLGCTITGLTYGQTYYAAVSYVDVRGLTTARLVLNSVVAGQTVASYVSTMPIYYGNGVQNNAITFSNYGLNIPLALATPSGFLQSNNIAYAGIPLNQTLYTLGQTQQQIANTIANVSQEANSAYALAQSQSNNGQANAISSLNNAVAVLETGSNTVAGQISTIQQGANTTNSTLQTIQVALGNSTTGLTGLVYNLNTAVQTSNTTIQLIQTGQTAANSATTLALSKANANIAGANTAILTLQQGLTTTNSALINTTTLLQGQITGANTTIQTVQQGLATTNVALVTTNTTIQAQLLGANTSIINNYNLFVSANGTLTTATQTLAAGQAAANSVITKNYNVLTSSYSTIANSLTTLGTQLGNTTANVTVIQGAVATLNSPSRAYWSVTANTSTGAALIAATVNGSSSNVYLGAQNIYFGNNAGFDTTTNTLQFLNGGLKRIIGDGFGASTGLFDWAGPSNYTGATATPQSAVFGIDIGGNVWINGAVASQWATLQTPYTPAATLNPNPNLCPNGEMSAGASSWTKAGTNTLHTTSGGPGGLAWYGFSTGNAIHQNKGIPATAGLPYSFSGWTNAQGIPSGTGSARLIYQWINSSGGVISSGLIISSAGGQGWLAGVVNGITAPSGTVSITIIADTADTNGNENNANNGNPFSGNSGLQVGWAGVKVEQSATATPLQGAQTTTTGGVYANGQTLDSLQPAQANADQTSLNAAADLIGKSPWAMASTAAGLQPSNVAGQVQHLNTSGQLPWGNSYLSGMPGWVYDTYLNNSNNLTGPKADYIGNQYNGQNLNQMWPATTSADKTGNAQAASVSGQGQWATYQGFSPTAVTQPSFNLCYNGDFSLGWEGWTTQGGSQPGVSKIANAYPGIFFAVSGSNGIWTNDVAIIGGGNYSFQVNLYNGAKDGHLRMLVQWLNSSKNFVSENANTIYVGYCPAGGGWQTKQLGNQVCPPDAAYARVYIDTTPDDASQTGAGVDFSNGGAIAWSGVKVEFGSQCTPMSREATTGSLYFDGTSVNQLRPATTQADKTGNAQAASISGQGQWATYQPAIPGYILAGTNYGSQNSNSNQTGTLDCAWVTWGTYDGSNDGNGHTLAPHMGLFDQTGRILQGQGLPINTQLAASYLYSNGSPFSSTAGSGTIQCASQTLYIVNQSFGLPSGSCSSLQTGQTYSMFYDFNAGAYVAIPLGSGSGYYQNPSRYAYAGTCYCPATGGGTSGGGGNRGIQP